MNPTHLTGLAVPKGKQSGPECEPAAESPLTADLRRLVDKRIFIEPAGREAGYSGKLVEIFESNGRTIAVLEGASTAFYYLTTQGGSQSRDQCARLRIEVTGAYGELK